LTTTVSEGTNIAYADQYSLWIKGELVSGDNGACYLYMRIPKILGIAKYRVVSASVYQNTAGALDAELRHYEPNLGEYYIVDTVSSAAVAYTPWEWYQEMTVVPNAIFMTKMTLGAAAKTMRTVIVLEKVYEK